VNLKGHHNNHQCKNRANRLAAGKAIVLKFRLEKWETGVQPNYEDSIKIKRFFRVKDFQNISEYFLKSFEAKEKTGDPEDVLTLKNQLLEEKDKRIESLEQTITLLKEALGGYETKKKG